MEYWGFRQLYEELVFDRDPDSVPAYLLGEGLDASRHLMRALQPYRSRLSPTKRESTSNELTVREHLWELYALSRVNDHLLLPFQLLDPQMAERYVEIVPRARSIELEVHDEYSKRDVALLKDGRAVAWYCLEFLPRISIGVYLEFFHSLGFEHFQRQEFSPFHHEIVEVEETTEATDRVDIVREFWPGLKFGEMMFSRSGVGVRCSPNVMAKQVAEQSTLYFAYRRVRRRTEDLSMDWGHNSQWRTEFRRDYEDDANYYFNVDGSIDVGGREPQWVAAGRPPWLSEAERGGPDVPPIEARREMVVHRCYVKCPLPDVDLWPYDDLLTVRKSETFWLP